MRYADLAPFLSKQTIMTSNLNNAATMSIDDYFTMNAYKGKIYKTTNMLGQTLAQVAGSDSVKLSREQQRIEREIAAFEKGIWGDQARKDSLDSIARLTPRDLKAMKKGRRTSTAKTVKPLTRRGSTPSGSSNARVTVRRQRH